MEPGERVGVIIVRVWSEPGRAVRARLTTVNDVVAGEEDAIELIAAQPEAIVAAFARWLEHWIAAE